MSNFYNFIGLNENLDICPKCPKNGLFGANMCISCAKKYCAKNKEFCGQNCPGCRAIVFSNAKDEYYNNLSPKDFPKNIKKNEQPCRFYLAGNCTKGEQCEFTHDKSFISPQNCWYYLNGGCKFGVKCKNLHISQKQQFH